MVCSGIERVWPPSQVSCMGRKQSEIARAACDRRPSFQPLCAGRPHRMERPRPQGASRQCHGRLCSWIPATIQHLARWQAGCLSGSDSRSIQGFHTCVRRNDRHHFAAEEGGASSCCHDIVVLGSLLGIQQAETGRHRVFQVYWLYRRMGSLSYSRQVVHRITKLSARNRTSICRSSPLREWAKLAFAYHAGCFEGIGIQGRSATPWGSTGGFPLPVGLKREEIAPYRPRAS